MAEYDFSPEFQRDILRIVLHDSAFMYRYRRALEAGYFTEPEHVCIAQTVLDVFDTIGDVPGAGTLLESFKANLPPSFDEDEIEDEIRALFKVGLPADAEAIRPRVIDFGRHQKLQAVLLKAPEYLKYGRYDEFEDAVREAGDLSGEGSDLVYDYFDTLEERLKQATRAARRVIGTGIANVDTHLPDGGLDRGELGVITGLMGYGKTTLLINIGANALRKGKRVFHATIGDMRERKVAQRYDANFCGMEVAKCRLNMQATRDTIESLLGADGLDRLKICYWDSYRANVGDIERKLRWLEVKHGWKPDVIIVDYPANLLPRGKMGDLKIWDRYEEIYKDCRSLGGTFDACTWTGLQANREAFSVIREGGVFDNEQAAGSLGPARDADVSITINMTKDERDDGIMRLHGAKVRDGNAAWTEECDVNFPTYTVKAADDFDDDPDVNPPRRAIG